jgi:uncharacterized phage protein (TIGR02218 family)
MKDFSPIAISSATVGFVARIGVITRLDGTIKRFAESDDAIVVGSDTYSPVPGLQLSAIKHTANGEVPSCEIVASHDSTGSFFDTDDIDLGLYDSATVQIYKVDLLNLSRKGLEFTGAISDTTYDPNEHSVTFSVKGPSASARVLIVRKRSPMCQVSLFSPLCGVDSTAYDVSTTVATIVDNFTFTVTGSLANPDGWFNQGVAVTSTGIAFMIGNWAQSSQTITAYPVKPYQRILSIGMGLTLYPGCDKTLGASGCAKFSNQRRFQGEPHFLGTAAASQQV